MCQTGGVVDTPQGQGRGHRYGRMVGWLVDVIRWWVGVDRWWVGIAGGLGDLRGGD